MTWKKYLGYNYNVKRTNAYLDAIHLVRFAAILWIGYLAVLAIINQSLWDPRRISIDTLYYYFLLGTVAVICLGLTYWTWVREKLGSAFLPAMIALITALPMLATWEIIRLFPRTQMLDPQGSVMRLIPFFLVGFLLVAWQYKWPFILLIILAITGLNLGIIWSFPSPSPAPFRGALTATLIQTVVFLAVGFSISFLITRLRNQQRSLQEANLHLTHYASTLEQLATTRERNRLARELHDTLAHTLSGLSVQLETVKAYWNINTETARSSLENSIATAHSGLDETRRALKALRANPLEDMGLARAMRTLIEDMAARANLKLDLFITDDLPELSPDVEQAIYRIAQEAVTNVVKHARADNLTVRLELIDGKVALKVQDNGIGFDLEKSKYSGQFGLTGMEERADIAGGTLSINSKPGQGTTLELVL